MAVDMAFSACAARYSLAPGRPSAQAVGKHAGILMHLVETRLFMLTSAPCSRCSMVVAVEHSRRVTCLLFLLRISSTHSGLLAKLFKHSLHPSNTSADSFC